jgi:hypothetical protein
VADRPGEDRLTGCRLELGGESPRSVARPLSGAHIAANSTAPSQERRFHNLLPKVEYKVGDWDDNTFGAELSDEEKTLRGFR